MDSRNPITGPHVCTTTQQSSKLYFLGIKVLHNLGDVLAIWREKGKKVKEREGGRNKDAETDFHLSSWRSGSEKGGEEEMNKVII